MLTDAGPIFTDPADGVAILESRGSTAETLGIPLAVLAELTHRCPLQCHATLSGSKVCLVAHARSDELSSLRSRFHR